MTHRIAISARTAPEPAEEDVGAAEATAARESAAESASDDTGIGDLDAAADSETAGDAEAAGARTPRRSALRMLLRPSRSVIGVVLIAVVPAGLAAAAITLGLAHRDSDRVGDRDLAVLSAARQEVVNLISPSAKDPTASANRIAADATGQWLAEFRAVKDKFVGAIDESKTDSTGEILGAGIEHHNPDGSTTVLVTAVSKVSNSTGAKDDPRTWRLRVDVVDEAAGYKLSKVEVVP
ncbi:hypothetical protein A5780_25750 [Nocardia sp. 852002-20019_SCH5090214]|uniref:Mce-associated membrane protein n=1 Tax=Nocardia nova TaxID=37330 RepID=A0A2S6A6Q3_9NOCA|nr:MULTISPECIES: hypothetical protein [Nocardia]OBA55272.1 hypothetical protein A5780_25750 [Nocardia sp. 852002-20019_SCH5090214]PPJ28225.1 hypothetical protein C5F51_15590 [Nocardia nova]